MGSYKMNLYYLYTIRSLEVLVNCKLQMILSDETYFVSLSLSRFARNVLKLKPRNKIPNDKKITTPSSELDIQTT